MAQSHFIQQRVSYNGGLCTVRYIGQVAGTNGDWLGVEWDDPTRGKHDGSHKGERYFKCLSQSPTAASFVRPTRPADQPQSFIGALNEKYAGDGVQHPDSQIVISGKVAQEMGFDKIWRKLGQAAELKVVILDGLRMASATLPGEATIRETCPKIVQLDMSRNLFQTLEPVVRICGELPVLRTLAINGNRFLDTLNDDTLAGSEKSFSGIKDLALEDTLLSWDEICHVASRCPSLTSLNASANQLVSLSSPNYHGLSSTLTSLNLEYNDFTSLADLASLTALSSLRNLHLKGNSIAMLAPPGSEAPVFSSSLQYLDVSYNSIESWSFVDRLTTHFPGITSLRLAHNPVYDTTEADSKSASSSEEAHMFTIARLAPLKSLNFSAVTATDRGNAEMFYLSRIAKQLAAVPESAEESVLTQHPRYSELCDVYGAPDVIRRNEINPAFLEARLVTVEFHRAGTEEKKNAKIPKSYDIYAVKGLAGKLFGLAPLKLKLVWETGEWDPVAGFDEKEGDSSDEDDAEIAVAAKGEAESAPEEQEGKPGRWIRREVELKDGPRQLGYCVDGLDVKIRVETR